MNLGEKIKEARIAANLSQSEVAKAMGFKGRDPGAPLCKWESGEREPKFANLAKLAGILQLPISHFIQPGVTFVQSPSSSPRRGCFKGRSGRPKGSKNKKKA